MQLAAGRRLLQPGYRHDRKARCAKRQFYFVSKSPETSGGGRVLPVGSSAQAPRSANNRRVFLPDAATLHPAARHGTHSRRCRPELVGAECRSRLTHSPQRSTCSRWRSACAATKPRSMRVASPDAIPTNARRGPAPPGHGGAGDSRRHHGPAALDLHRWQYRHTEAMACRSAGYR